MRTISLNYCFVCFFLLYVQSAQGKLTRLNVTNSFIVHGHPVDRPMPYQVSCQWFSKGAWQHVCGGSIITRFHVLTAAQCFDDQSTDGKSVLAGTTSLSSEGYRHELDWILKHPDYDGSLWYDIEIVRVKKYFRWSMFIKPIPYKSGDIFPAGQLCWVSGWGRLHHNTTLTPDILNMVGVTTMSNEDCDGYWEIDALHICTWGRRGPCEGDAGGPLVNSDQTLLVGIVTSSPNNCVTGLPDVYTRVSWFVDWIRNNL